MSDARLEQFKQMVAEFPDAPMAHFSLGKVHLERREYAEAVKSMAEAVRLDPEYAAALVALGEAHVGAGQAAQAREVWQRARAVALSQNHASLAEEVDERLAELG